MRRIALIAMMLLMSCALFGQESGPSSEGERARAVQIAQKLEANPLDSSLQSDREWLLKWAIAASDFTVGLCTSRGESKKKYKYGPELAFQKLASATAFVLQHPDEQKNKVEQELAAVNGALNAYEAILRIDPKRRSDYWDDLLNKRADGSLKEFVAKYVTEDCSGGN